MQLATANEHEWTAPGPGHWRRDDSHMPGTISLHMWELLLRIVERGMPDALERYGVLLAGMDMRRVGGRPWARPRAVGAPEQPGPPPPRFVFRLLMLLHPTLRRRAKQAERALAGKIWREDARRWREELAPALEAENRELQAIDPGSMSDPELAAHLRRTREALIEGAAQHFRQSLAYQFPVGDWLRCTCEWTGVSASTALAVLRGCSPFSASTVEPVARVAAAVAADPDARAVLLGDADPSVRLHALRTGAPAVARALDEYLRDYGQRLVTGFDLCEHTLIELPQLVLSTIAAGLDAAAADPAPAAAQTGVDALRSKVPAEHRPEWDEMLAEAQLVYGLRDEDVGVSWTWREGIVRHAVLETARRLRARGALRELGDVFETTPDELDALLQGKHGPSADEVAARAAERARLEQLEAPIALGEPEAPPPDDYFPAATLRIMKGVMFYMAHTDLDAVAPAATPTSTSARRAELAGHAASGGVYEGPARVVKGPRDFARVQKGDVLIARITSPTYNVLLPLVGAVVTDRGGALCHAAIVAREFGIPGVVGTKEATARIHDGDRVRVDGDRGVVEVLARGVMA